MAKGAGRFDWSGGHPALDFVNTLDERPLPKPIENLADYSDLVGFAQIAGLITSAQTKGLRRPSGVPAARTVRRARRLREDVFEALTALRRRKAISSATLRNITTAIRGAHAARMLSMSQGSSFACHSWASPQAADVPLHACALVIEDLLTGADRNRIRKCRAPDCAVFFLDKSKAQRRHWCSMDNCGNREKQRRWRAS